jgi:hypothetical protein
MFVLCCYLFVQYLILPHLSPKVRMQLLFQPCRLLFLPGALVVGALGITIDGFMFSLIALCKSPIMLFKGWRRLVQDLIGREGPFLETACVPFAGLAILLWPLAVLGSVIASMLSSIPLGAYGAVVTYQVRQILFTRKLDKLVALQKQA